MPAVLAPRDYDRWLGTEPDPRDLLKSLSVGSDGDLANINTGQFVLNDNKHRVALCALRKTREIMRPKSTSQPSDVHAEAPVPRVRGQLGELQV